MSDRLDRLRSVSRRDILEYGAMAPAILPASALLPAPRAAAGLAGMAVFLDPGATPGPDVINLAA